LKEGEDEYCCRLHTPARVAHIVGMPKIIVGASWHFPDAYSWISWISGRNAGFYGGSRLSRRELVHEPCNNDLRNIGKSKHEYFGLCGCFLFFSPATAATVDRDSSRLAGALFYNARGGL
jgi:hypothetical protein